MLPRACAVGKGHELHAGAESKAKPPLQKHRCQCSVPGQCSPTRGREAAGRLGEALGHSGGCHSGVQRSCSLSRATQHHDHSSLSRVSECKGPGSHIQQGKDHGQLLKGKSSSQLCVLWPGYTPCPGHSIGSCSPQPRAPRGVQHPRACPLGTAELLQHREEHWGKWLRYITATLA